MKFPLDWIGEFVRVPDHREPAPPSAAGGSDPHSTGAEVAFRPASIDDLARLLTRSGMVVDAVEEGAGSVVFEIDVPTNRPDAMNVRGLAREIAAATGATLEPVPQGVPDARGEAPAGVRIEIADGDLCGRYCARVIRGLRVGPSPEKVARRLRDAGLNVLNNVVDATNYVLWELGHPLHAFDLARLEGRRIVIRRARAGETLVTLDGIERALDPEMLVIADARRPVALAGIMGGADSMITASTTDILLESAWFAPSSVRKTARRLGLSTDASYRFERGADRETAPVALERAAFLIADLTSGRVAPGLIDVHGSPPPPPRKLRLRLERARRLLGMDVESGAATGALAALGFGVTPGDAAIEVTVPSWRQDVLGEADLVEEVGRIVGYEGIPERHPALPGHGALNRAGHAREDEVRASLLASGFTEVMSLPFVGAWEDEIGRPAGSERLRLTNPMAEGQEHLRTTLLPGLAGVVRRNHRHGVRDLAVFEIGRAFHRAAGRRDPESVAAEASRERRDPEALRQAGKGVHSLEEPAEGDAPRRPADRPAHAPRAGAGSEPASPQVAASEAAAVPPGRSGFPGLFEPLLCGLAMTGLARERHWSETSREASLHDVKGAIEEAADRLGTPVSFHPLDAPLFRRGAGLEVRAGGRTVGRLGEISGAAAGKLDLRGPMHFAELSLTDLFSLEAAPRRYAPLPRFPSATRDLALVVPNGVLWSRIEAAIRDSGGRIVSEVHAFDRYTGESLGEGRVSLAVGIVFQDPERTLAAEDVQAAERAILAALDARLGITLRQ